MSQIVNPTKSSAPGGADKALQFNDGGSFGGGLATFDKATNVLSAPAVAAGSVPAQAGPLRIPNATYLFARNGANSGDVPMIGADAGDVIYIGQGQVVAVYGKLSVGGVIEPGAGIAFPNGYVPSPNYTTLDEYREIEWAPYLYASGGASGQVIANAAGTITKIGRQVFFEGSLTMSAKGTTAGQIFIGGLPYGTKNPYVPSVSFGYYFGASASLGTLTGLITGTQIYIYINGGQGALTDANILNNFEVHFSGHYAATS